MGPSNHQNPITGVPGLPDQATDNLVLEMGFISVSCLICKCKMAFVLRIGRGKSAM